MTLSTPYLTEPRALNWLSKRKVRDTSSDCPGNCDSNPRAPWDTVGRGQGRCCWSVVPLEVPRHLPGQWSPQGRQVCGERLGGWWGNGRQRMQESKNGWEKRQDEGPRRQEGAAAKGAWHGSWVRPGSRARSEGATWGGPGGQAGCLPAQLGPHSTTYLWWWHWCNSGHTDHHLIHTPSLTGMTSWGRDWLSAQLCRKKCQSYTLLDLSFAYIHSLSLFSGAINILLRVLRWLVSHMPWHIPCPMPTHNSSPTVWADFYCENVLGVTEPVTGFVMKCGPSSGYICLQRQKRLMEMFLEVGMLGQNATRWHI